MGFQTGDLIQVGTDGIIGIVTDSGEGWVEALVYEDGERHASVVRYDLGVDYVRNLSEIFGEHSDEEEG